MQTEITNINTQGDGVGFFNGKKVFIQKTYVGDVVDFDILKESKDFIIGKLNKIITPSKDRIKSPCPYFEKCGGCNFMCLSDQAYYNYKQNIVEKLGFKVNDFVKIGFNSRRRVFFKVKNNKLGFFEKDTNNLVEIDNCILLNNQINSIIPDLKQIIKKININEISVANYENGLDILFNLKKDLTLQESQFLTDFAKNHKNIICISYQIDKKEPFLLLKKEFPTLTFDNGIKIELESNIFLQATLEGQKAITKIVVETLKNCKNVLDLYCGIGTYTFPLSTYAKIQSVEGSQKMIDILNKNIKHNHLSNKIAAKCKDLVNSPLLINELKDFDGVVINPPRNGAKAQCEILAKSNIQKIVMVSCNPTAFKTDANILLSGYKLEKVVCIDQFFKTPHLEVVGVFSK